MPSFGSDVMRRSIELAIQATGTQALDDVAAKIKYNSDVMQVLADQYKQSVITGDEYRAGVARLVMENLKLQAALDAHIRTSADVAAAQRDAARSVQVYTDIIEEAYEAELTLDRAQVQSVATKQQLQQEADKTNRVMRNFSYTVLSAGHAFQDAAQGGFGAVLNNIPLLTQGFTNLAADMGNFADSTRAKLMAWAPAVAGSFTIVATAGYVLYQNWDKLERMFNGGIPRPVLDTTAELERKLKAAKDRTEELGKLTSMTVAEVLEYRKGTQAVKEMNEQLQRQKELKELLEGQSKDTRERASGFKEAFAVSGAGSALDELRQALNRQEDASGKVFNPVKNAMTTATEAAQDMVVEAGRGDRSTITAIQKALRDAFGNRSGFAANIQRFSPEGEAMAKQGQQHGEILDRMNEEIVKAEEQAAEKRKNALISYWVGDEQKVASNLERGIEREKQQAERDAARGDKADERAMGQLLRNNAAADQKAAKVQAAEELAGRFGDFSPEFAAHGGRLLRDRINRGQPEQAAFNAVYMELLKTAANQEKQTGMLGEATQRLMALEQHNRMVQARLNQIQGQMQRGRNRRPTLLPDPAQK